MSNIMKPYFLSSTTILPFHDHLHPLNPQIDPMPLLDDLPNLTRNEKQHDVIATMPLSPSHDTIDSRLKSMTPASLSRGTSNFT